MDDLPRDSPGVVVPPPLIYLSFFLAGLALQRLVPLPAIPASPFRPIGMALVAAGVGLDLWSLGLFWARRTNPIPFRPASRIVADGPYRFTRNPMYLGTCLVFAGAAAWSGQLWPLLLLPVVLLVMTEGVIKREEGYLDREFGEEYRRYRARVRRWL